MSCPLLYPAEQGRQQKRPRVTVLPRSAALKTIPHVSVSQALRVENECIRLDDIRIHWPGDPASDDEEAGDGQSRVSSEAPLSPAAITLEVCAEIHITVAYTARCSPGAHISPLNGCLAQAPVPRRISFGD